VGCDGVRWQGATTLRASARKEKQRRRRAPARLNRVRSVVTIEMTLLVRTKARVHKAYPAEESGQLRFLGATEGNRITPAGADPGSGWLLLQRQWRWSGRVILALCGMCWQAKPFICPGAEIECLATRAAKWSIGILRPIHAVAFASRTRHDALHV